MAISPEQAFVEGLKRAAAALGTPVDRVTVSYPPSASQGDLASPLCFELARAARKPPRALAEALVAANAVGGGIARVEAAGGGYVNAFLDRGRCLADWLLARPSTVAPSPG